MVKGSYSFLVWADSEDLANDIMDRMIHCCTRGGMVERWADDSSLLAHRFRLSILFGGQTGKDNEPKETDGGHEGHT